MMPSSNNNNSNASSSSSSSGGGRGGAAAPTSKKWGFAASAGTAWKNMVDKTYQSSRDLMDKTKVASNKMAESTKLSTQKMAQSTQKMAEATKQSTQKMAEATKQSSQRFAELSKRNSEKLLQKVKFDTQRLQQQQQEQEMDGTTPITTSTSTSTTSNRGANRSSIMMMGNTLNWIPNVNGNKNKQAPDVLADTMEEALEKFMTLMDNEHEVHIKWELQMTPFFIKDNTDHQDIYKAFLNWGREERLTTAAQEMANRVSQSMASSNSGGIANQNNNNNNNIGSSGEMEITFVPQEGELPAPGVASTDTESTASSSTTTSTNNKDSTATTTATGTTFTENGTETTEIVYNVTKALKRFEVYATWMEDHRADLTDLSAESLTDAARAWNLKLQLDLQGRLVWYVDVATMDIDKILHKDSMTLEESTSHSISLRDSLRWIVFMSHIMMLDESAQEHGMVVVLSMGDKTMVESVGLLPKMERLAKKLDKFTIGKLPVKLKTVYILPGVGKQGRWVSVVTGLLKAFLSDVMRRRICVVDNVIKGTPVSAETYLFDKLGKEKVPIGFGGLDGSCPQDIIFGRFITSAESEKAILAAALEGDVVAEEEGQQEEGAGATTLAAASADGDADAPTPALTKEEAANDTFVIE